MSRFVCLVLSVLTLAGCATDTKSYFFDHYSKLKSNGFSWRRKWGNGDILAVLLAEMNFSRVGLYGLPARKADDV